MVRSCPQGNLSSFFPFANTLVTAWLWERQAFHCAVVGTFNEEGLRCMRYYVLITVTWAFLNTARAVPLDPPPTCELKVLSQGDE